MTDTTRSSLAQEVRDLAEAIDDATDQAGPFTATSERIAAELVARGWRRSGEDTTEFAEFGALVRGLTEQGAEQADRDIALGRAMVDFLLNKGWYPSEEVTSARELFHFESGTIVLAQGEVGLLFHSELFTHGKVRWSGLDGPEDHIENLTYPVRVIRRSNTR